MWQRHPPEELVFHFSEGKNLVEDKHSSGLGGVATKASLEFKSANH